jgi:hypothetical protein
VTGVRREPDGVGSTAPGAGSGPGRPEAPAVGVREEGIPGVRNARDGELAADGWVRRFTGSPPRLVEVKELYESTGQEVLLDEVLPGELAPECEGCTLALSLFKVIYTRRPGAE